eukprot:TRINITY_DN4600_c0_g1_i7.p1 TRINITY_DN4600_c0_g1~~TRINITY_DN4600_c0_g1_i7.p1  ORF type:complete len:346 (+),score=40.34 TRINITY_DN4600_c0_g1_i7:44-1039(+)
MGTDSAVVPQAPQMVAPVTCRSRFRAASPRNVSRMSLTKAVTNESLSMNDLPEMLAEDTTDSQSFRFDGTSRVETVYALPKLDPTAEISDEDEKYRGQSFKSADAFVGASKSLNDLPGMNPEPPTGRRSVKSSPQHRCQFIPSEDFGLVGFKTARAASWQGRRVHRESSDEAHVGPPKAILGYVQSSTYGARGRRNCRSRNNVVTFKGFDQALTCGDIPQRVGASFSSRQTTADPLSSVEDSDGCLCGDDLPIVKSESEDDTNAMVSKKSVEREGGGLMCLSELPRVGDENIVLHSGTSNWSSRTGSVNADDADTSGFEAPQATAARWRWS